MDCSNLIVVSDLHCGCRLGLCTPDKVKLDDGGWYTPSGLQLKQWAMWREFWDEWVPDVTRREPYAIAVNGDLVDGVHHRATTTISNNMIDQRRVAVDVLKRERDKRKCKALYVIRGTEAHGGLSGTDEEQIATDLDAIPNAEGQRARWELWIRVGGGLVHLLHHIGTTGSQAYESTALTKELTEAYVEAGRWNRESPAIIGRSHRHRQFEVRLPRKGGEGIAFVTPGWQAKTPFAFRIPGARQSQPQFGGSLIRQGDEELYTRHQVWDLERPVAE